MSRILTIDVGAGTLDLLYYDTQTTQHTKAVFKSPVKEIAQKIKKTNENLVITGVEMGGGELSSVLKKHVQKKKVFITPQAAATIHHSLDRVSALGFQLVDPDKAKQLIKKEGFFHLETTDVDPHRLKGLIEHLGLAFSFDIVGICVQDHGVAPPGTSHLDYRQHIFKPLLDKDPTPESLLYSAKKVPETLNRMNAVARTGCSLPAEEVFVMDSGMAAILGACMDLEAQRKTNKLILDIATTHTVGAAVRDKEIFGYFEYHTRDIDTPKTEALLKKLADGDIDHKKILEQGGHGAYLRDSFGFENTEIIVATGPRRGMFSDTRLPVCYGAPLGDNMMTGTVGILEAIRRKKDLPPVDYI